MKTIQKLALSFLLVFSFSSMLIAGDPKPFKNAADWIPADFDSRKSTLLIEKFVWHDAKKAQKVNDDMKEYAQQHYPYKFELVDGENIGDAAKYADKDKYRYALMMSDKMHTTHSTNMNTGMSSSRSLDVFDFHIYDRKLDKHYPVTTKYSSLVMLTFRPVIITIADHLKDLKK